MIRVIGIDKSGNMRDLGVEEGTIEDVKKALDEVGFNIISIKEE